MNRRAELYLGYLFLFAACVYGGGCNGCAGTPSGFNKITLGTTSTVVLQSGTAVVTATVTNDASSSGVSWTLTGAGTLSSSTKFTVTYTAPASVAAETVVTVNASAVDFPSQKASIQITVEPNVSITTTSLAGGNYGSPYTAMVNAIGGLPPFIWSVSTGSLPPGLTLGSSNTRSVTISGTPTAEVNTSFTIEISDSGGHTSFQSFGISIGAPLPLAVATTTLPNGSLTVNYPNTTLQASGGVPPFSWALLSGSLPPGLTLESGGGIQGIPTSTGTFPFAVRVTDSESPAATANANLSITVTDLSILSGNYAFEFNGFTSMGNAIAVVGSFTADGQGNITNGVEDVNAVGASPKNQTFTGAYTGTGDDRGVVTFSSLAGSPAYAFSMTYDGSHGRFIEFDSTGTRGSGDLETRSVATCTATTFNGNYAFGLVGQQVAVTGVSSAGPDVIVGSFTAAGAVSPSTQGSLGPGELDANTPVQVTTQAPVSGSYQTTSQPTRCSMTLSSAVQETMNFSVYPISPFESFLVETDTISSDASSGAPILSFGTIEEQTGAPFLNAAGSTFTATSVAALTGRAPVGNSYVPDVAIVSLTGTGTSSFTMSGTENQAGTVSQYAPFQANFEEADQYGRVTTDITSPFGPVFYMISQNTAFCIGEELSQETSQPYPFFGLFSPQTTGPFTAGSIAGTFEGGTGSPAESTVQDVSGTFTLVNTGATSGSISGMQDQSTSMANTPGQSVTGGYTVTDDTAGNGTTAFSEPAISSGSFLIQSPSRILMITTSAGDTNPVVVIFQQ